MGTETQEAQLARVLDSITDAFVILDSEWRIVYANAHAARLNRKPVEDFLGKTVWEEWPESVGSELEHQYRSAVQNRQPAHFEHRYITSAYDVWIEVHAYPIENGLALYYHDITERKRAQAQEESLKAQLTHRVEEFETLFGVVPVGIAISLDAECRDIRINPAFARMLGTESSGNVSKSGPQAEALPFQFLKDGKEVPAEELPQQVAQRTALPYGPEELEILRHDGKRMSLYGSAVPLFDEHHRVRGSIAAFVDFTQRKEEEQRNQILTERLNFHLQNTPLAVIEFDSEFRIRTWSKRAEEIFGWTADEVMGQPYQSLRWVYEEDASSVQHVIRQFQSGHVKQNIISNRNYDQFGNVLWCEWYNSVLSDPNGKLTSLFSFVLDVTERKKSESALQQTNRDLERFSDILAHDLKEPLWAISLFSDMLSTDLQPVLAKAGDQAKSSEEQLKNIRDGVQRLMEMVDGLLAFTRLARTGRLPAHQTSAVSALETAIYNLQRLIHDNNASITHQGPLPDVMFEPNQLVLVFQNILSNAIRYKKPNEAPTIRITAHQKNNECVFAIADNGVGFEMDYAERIFEPFERLLERSRAGSGLGLAIVKRTVERFGGRVWAESKPGEGSTFYFSAPCA